MKRFFKGTTLGEQRTDLADFHEVLG